MLNHDTRHCIRCTLEQRRDVPTWATAQGPYWVRPQPISPGIIGAQQYLILERPIETHYVALLLHYHLNDEVERGTVLLPHINLRIQMSTLFTVVRSTHRCRDRAWCHVKTMTGVYWWPDAVPVENIAHLQLVEVDPPPPVSSDGSRTCTTTMGATSQNESFGGCTDNVNDNELDDQQTNETSLNAEPGGDHNNDEVNMMATARPRSRSGNARGLSPSSHFIRLYTAGESPETLRIDPLTLPRQHRTMIGRHLGLEQGQEVWNDFLIFRVLPTPPEFDPLYNDLYVVAFPFEIDRGWIFGLCDLEVERFSNQIDNYEYHRNREVVKMRSPTLRRHILDALSITAFCQTLGDDRCEVRVAGQQWDFDDTQVKWIMDGTYMVVTVRSTFSFVPVIEQLRLARSGASSQQLTSELNELDRQGSEETSFLQRGINHQFFRHPTDGLPPPGNTVNLHTMDTVVDKEGVLCVVDADENEDGQMGIQWTTKECHNKFTGNLNTMDKVLYDDVKLTVRDDMETLPRKLQLAELLAIPTPARPPRTQRVMTSSAERQRNKMTLPAHVSGYSDFVHFEPFADMLDTTIEGHKDPPEIVQQWLTDVEFLDWFTWDPMDCQCLHVFTDGSYDGNRSSWSFLVIAIHGEQETLLGHRRGIAEPLSSMDRHSATNGEQHALLWSSLWLLKYVMAHDWNGRLHFFWDSMTAGNKAEGSYQVKHDHVGTHVRHIQQALEIKLGAAQVQHSHVRAHTGVPQNETADFLAKQALLENTPPQYRRQKEDFDFLAEGSQVLKWLWWWCNDKSTGKILPSCDNTEISWDARSNCEVDLKRVADTGMITSESHETHDCNKQTFSLIVGTYNCQSLSENMIDGSVGALQEAGKAALLRHQLDQQGVHFLGIQEARTPAGTVRSGTHLRIASGCTKDRSLGTELWVSLTLPYIWDSQGRPTERFQVHNFTVIKQTPRLLIVHHEHAALPCYIVVAHAPHSGRPQNEREDWWIWLHEMMKPFRQQDIVLLVDANVRVSGMEGPNFGDLNEGTTKDAELFMHPLLSDLSLFAPATYSQWHMGPTSTWIHPNKHSLARIDYVILPILWKMASLCSWTDYNIHVGTAGLDHLCALVQIEWQQKHRGVRLKCHKFDQVSMATPEAQTRLTDIILNAPSVGWDTNASEHAAILTEYFQKQLQQEFPYTKRHGNHAVVSAEAQALYADLSHGKRTLRAYAHFVNNLFLRKLFDCWKGIQWKTETGGWSHALHLQHSYWSMRVPRLAKQLRGQLRMDKKQYLEGVAKLANTAKPNEVYKLLRPILPKAKQNRPVLQPLPQLQKRNGVHAQNATDMLDRWIEHFAALECGNEVDPLKFLEEAIVRQQQTCLPTTWNAEDLPPLSSLEHAIRKMANGKATGPDGIPSELLKASPRIAAYVLYPLLAKFCLRMEEAIQHKGGKLVALFKGRGSVDDCASFRGILLLSNVGKVLRAASRSTVNAPYQQSSDSMQLGGKPSQQAIFGSQTVRSFISVAKAKGFSAAILFCDIAAAFYKALREVAFGATVKDEDMALIAKRLNLRPEVLPKLHQALNGESAYTMLGATTAQQSYLRESLTSTWFQMGGPRCVATNQGTRPGDSWADVVFNVLFSQVILQLRERLGECGLTIEFPKPRSRNPFEKECLEHMETLFHVTWADDLAVMLKIATPTRALHQVAEGSAQLLQILAEFGMEATIGSGKTEIIVILRGPESTKIRRQIFTKSTPTIPILTEDTTVQIPLTTSYKHLGGMITWKGDLTLEIQTRTRKAVNAYWKIARNVFQSKFIDLPTKVGIFRATVLSVFLWGSGAWPSLSQAEFDCFQKATWRLYRLIIPPQRGISRGQIPHDHILTTLNLPHPRDILPEQRCRHLAALIRSAPDPLWAVLIQDEKGTQAYREAVLWIWQAIGREKILPHYQDWQAWIQVMVATPGKWKNLVKKAADRYQWYRHRHARVRLWKQNLLRNLQEAGLIRAPERELQGRNVCLLCKKVFTQKRAWFLHANIKHNYLSKQGRVAVGRYCFLCQKLYANCQRLQNHLRYSTRCREYFKGMQDAGVDLGEHQTALPQQHEQCPWIPFEIPLADESNFSASSDSKEVYEGLRTTLLTFVPCETEQETADQLIGALKEILLEVHPFEDILAGFNQWKDTLKESTDAVIRNTIPHLELWLAQHFDDTPLEGLYIQEDVQILRAESCQRGYVPQELLFLHFYSGRRRDGDLQECFEAIPLPPGHILTILSIDTQVDPVNCDLLDWEKQQRWLTIIQRGEVAGIGSGPPCESWSVARFRPTTGGGPRPVRTISELWGLIDISRREHQQVWVGSDLMGFQSEQCSCRPSQEGLAFLSIQKILEDLPPPHRKPQRSGPVILSDGASRRDYVAYFMFIKDCMGR